MKRARKAFSQPSKTQRTGEEVMRRGESRRGDRTEGRKGHKSREEEGGKK